MAALRHVRDTKLNILLGNVKAAIVDKKRAAIACEEALYVLRKTQLSGTGKTMDLASITIADFTFIKRISAGAYARVFLAQKRRTGDIYAIKVLPKTEVVQKNQVKRVMLEKDILLQYHNPYIVNFCMFVF
jgi:serine/threonine protein kinase